MRPPCGTRENANLKKINQKDISLAYETIKKTPKILEYK